MSARIAMASCFRFGFVFGKLRILREAAVMWPTRRRPNRTARKPSYRPEVEELSPKCLPGSLLNHPALAPVALLSIEITDFGRDAASIGVPDSSTLTVVAAPSHEPAGSDPVGLDGFWSQAGSKGDLSGPVDDVTVPEHPDSDMALPADRGGLFGSLGGVVLSTSIAQALANPLAVSSGLQSGSGGAHGSGAGLMDNSAGAAATAAAATGGGAAGTTSLDSHAPPLS